MKKKSIFLIPALALLAISAIGVGASIKANSEVKVAKADETITIYFDGTRFGDYDRDNGVTLHYWGDGGDLKKECTCVADNYWYAEIPATGFTHYQFFQHQAFVDSNTFNWLPQTDDPNNYYCQATSYSSCDWFSPDLTIWKVDRVSGDDINLSLNKFDGSGLQVYSLSVVLAENDVVEFTNGTITAGYSDLRSNDNQSANEKGYVVDDGDGKIEVVKAGTYEVYVNVMTGSTWMQIDSLSEARIFCEDFIDEMEDICGTSDPEWSVDHAGSALNTVWSKYATAFGHLTTGAVSKFNGNPDKDATIAQARSLYAHVIDRYKLTAWDRVSLSGRVIADNYSETVASVDSTMLIVVAASLVTVAAFSAFFLLKRKEK